MKTNLIICSKSDRYSFKEINIFETQLKREEIASDLHRKFVGGMWDEIGVLQFNFLKDYGLERHHKLLDIGCGCLRGGIHFIRYLNPGCYYGVDINRSLLEAGCFELEKQSLLNKGSTLLENDMFQFYRLRTKFDYILAVSVFTHLFFNNVARCFSEVKEVLKPTGHFFATYFEAPRPIYTQILNQDPGEISTQYDRDPFHCSPKELGWLADNAGLSMKNIGDWNHPNNQKIAVFNHS